MLQEGEAEASRVSKSLPAFYESAPLPQPRALPQGLSPVSVSFTGAPLRLAVTNSVYS